MELNLEEFELQMSDTIGRLMNIISRKAQMFLSKELKANNLSIVPNQIMFLMILYREGKLKQEEFTQIHYLDKGNSAKALKGLEEEGYICKVKDEKDKRAYIVYPTEKALEIKLVMLSILKKLDTHLGRNLSSEEYIQLLSLLKKI